MATINHKTYNEGTETFKDFSVYDGKDTLIFKVDGSAQSAAVTGTLAVSGNATFDTNTLVVDSANDRVGIGTSAPASALEVKGANATLRLTPASQNQSQAIELGVLNSSVNAYAKIDVTNTLTYDSNIRFFTNTNSSTTQVERMRIAYDGNVGIGTSAPAYRFNVVTDAIAGAQNLAAIDRTAQNFVTFTNPQFSTDASMGLLLRVFPQSDARQGAGILASGGAANGETDLNLFVSSGTVSSTSYSALTLKGGSGNVGIGTGVPANKLVVKSAGYGAVASFLDASDNGFVFKADGFNGFNAIDQTQQLIMNFSGSEKYRFNTDGTLQVGSGIVFPATQVASADPNTLDDYEEGTWTPTISFGGASVGVTYAASRAGQYTKIGRQVTATAYILLTNKGTSTGSASIGGLPYVIGATSGFYSSACFSAISQLSYVGMLQGYGEISTNRIDLVETTEAGSQTNITDADFTNVSQVLVQFTYFV
jgi:hypothetical protein